MLRGTYTFDFESGGEAANHASADVWWEQQTAVQRQLVPWNGAALCSLGVVGYEQLQHDDLSGLSYSSTPVTANAEGTNFLPDGAVLAVRTRMGKLVKVQVLSYGYNLSLRWEECLPPVRYLLCRATIGSAPDWLVTRYVVDSSYVAPDGSTRGCGHAELGAAGGIVEGQIPESGGRFPATVRISVALDFRPETELHGLVKAFVADVESTGVNFLFEPNQVVQRTRLLFDLRPAALPGDFLLIRWQHTSSGVVVASGQQLMEGSGLAGPGPADCEIVFIPDPISAVDMSVDITGTFQGAPLSRFAQTFLLSEHAVLLRAATDDGQHYSLTAV
ncbi:hypothetical protein [Friedmanniella luteola]|uniref:hypothetical protein n=1 Tax=Friedmanniella luteola TaxID=546871 RepID=UPI000B816606|nr:hypothetical protein [Friedmanniella luteola]